MKGLIFFELSFWRTDKVEKGASKGEGAAIWSSME